MALCRSRLVPCCFKSAVAPDVVVMAAFGKIGDNNADISKERGVKDVRQQF